MSIKEFLNLVNYFDPTNYSLKQEFIQTSAYISLKKKKNNSRVISKPVINNPLRNETIFHIFKVNKAFLIG